MPPPSRPWQELGNRMAEVFKALGDVNRMMIIKILASNPDESVCVVEMAEMLSISQPATSQHLRVLKNVGILVPKRVGNRTYYSIDEGQLRRYKDVIDNMFRMAFVRCTMEGDCDQCPHARECLERM